MILSISSLTKEFPGHRAVDDLSFDIGLGEIVGLLGPNGAGKTTLIHMILGLLRPTSGKILLFGMELEHRRQEILRRMNFSSAYVQLPYSLTPQQNLEIFARLYGVAHPKKRAAELLERMEIADMAGRPTRAMSSGQLSRLNLAKSLLNDPELLLLDEPTASMDPDIADKTRTILRGIQKEKKITILYTSHNMKEIESMATRVIFLQKGKIIAQGSPAELIRAYNQEGLEQVFLKLARQ